MKNGLNIKYKDDIDELFDINEKQMSSIWI
jgi:hypothetical protein